MVRLQQSKHQLLIEELFYEKGLTVEQILQTLQEKYNVTTNTKRALESRMQAWGIRKRQPQLKPEELSEIENLIESNFYLHNMRDSCMVVMLNSHGYDISERKIRRIRIALNIRRRILNTPEDRETYTRRLRVIMERELMTGIPSQYGREYFRTYLQQKGVPVVRDVMFSILKELDPEGVAARLPKFKTRRDKTGRYIVPGPDHVWSVDGHLKLARFGFGIYAMVDGYSRYIVGFHVGLSVTTAVSIMKQYCMVVEATGKRPQRIRSDHGTETVLMANAHWQIAQRDDPTLPMPDVYRYGTSKANSRIESWWEKMTKGQLQQWRKFFRSLETEGLFGDKNDSDRIAAAFLFTELIRDHITEFVSVWNNHHIRFQSNRNYVVPGQPHVNYHYPKANNNDAVQCGIPVDATFTSQLLESVKDYYPYMAVSSYTYEWCIHAMNEFSYTVPFRSVHPSSQQLYRSAYLALREKIRKHMEFNPTASDCLQLAEVPRGAYDWEPLMQDGSPLGEDIDFDCFEGMSTDFEVTDPHMLYVSEAEEDVM